jgi:hypothetical protein
MCGRIRAVGQIRTISVCALLATAAVLAMAGTASATPLDYTFSSSNQGWQQAQNPANGPEGPAGFRSSGGNPGGRLSTKDSGAETGCHPVPPGPPVDPCQLLTFYSPFVPFLGANYGGTASFDLRSTVNPEFAAEFLLLAEGSDYLDGLIPESSGTGYHRLSIQMDETANWAVCPYAGGSCSPPSRAQFMGLIAATDVVAVIADVGPDGTDETYDLDNVVLTDGGPLPQPPPPVNSSPPTAKKKCKKQKKRAAAAKKKKCKKKRRAAASGFRG